MAGRWASKRSPPRSTRKWTRWWIWSNLIFLQQGFISRTKSGRKANDAAYKLLNVVPPPGSSTQLFEGEN